LGNLIKFIISSGSTFSFYLTGFGSPGFLCAFGALGAFCALEPFSFSSFTAILSSFSPSYFFSIIS